MGYNTTLMLLNDAIHSIEDDPKFGARLAGAIATFGLGNREPLGIHARGFINAVMIIESHASDHERVVRIGHNTGRVDDQIDKEIELQKRYVAEERLEARYAHHGWHNANGRVGNIQARLSFAKRAIDVIRKHLRDDIDPTDEALLVRSMVLETEETVRDATRKDRDLSRRDFEKRYSRGTTYPERAEWRSMAEALLESVRLGVPMATIRERFGLETEPDHFAELLKLVEEAGGVVYLHDQDCAQWRKMPCDKGCGLRAYAERALTKASERTALVQKVFDVLLASLQSGPSYTASKLAEELGCSVADLHGHGLQAIANAIFDAQEARALLHEVTARYGDNRWGDEESLTEVIRRFIEPRLSDPEEDTEPLDAPVSLRPSAMLVAATPTDEE